MRRGKWALSEVEARQLSELSSNLGRPGERARLILLSAAGRSAVEVAEQLNITIPTVYKWRRRFSVDGISGLKDRARPGQPRRLSPAQRHEIGRVTRDDLPQLGRRWTIRLLSSLLGVTQHQVRMVWQEHGLARHVVSTRLATHAAEGQVSLRGLFIQPPLSALAIVVDGEGKRAADAVPPPSDSSPLRAIYARAPAARGCDLTDVTANLLAFVAAVRDATPPGARLELVFSSGTVFSVPNLVHNLGLTQGIKVSAWARADAWIDSIEAWLASASFHGERSAITQLGAETVRYLEGSEAECPFAWVRGRREGLELRAAPEGGSRPDSARLRGPSQPRAPH